MPFKPFFSMVCSHYRLPRDAADLSAVSWAHTSTRLPHTQHALEEQAGTKNVQEHHVPGDGQAQCTQQFN